MKKQYTMLAFFILKMSVVVHNNIYIEIIETDRTRDRAKERHQDKDINIET